MRYQCRNPDEVKCIMYVIQSARDSAYMLVYKKRYFMVYTKNFIYSLQCTQQRLAVHVEKFAKYCISAKDRAH